MDRAWLFPQSLIKSGLAQTVEDVVDRGRVAEYPSQSGRGIGQIGVHQLEFGERGLCLFDSAELSQAGDNVA